MNAGTEQGSALPFEFDASGQVTVNARWAEMPGIEEFARHYAGEWLVWRGAGLAADVCDIAAFMVAAGCYQFLRDCPPGHKAEWLKSSFFPEGEGVPPEYPEKTRAVLKGLRRAIPDAPGKAREAAGALLPFALPIEKILVLGGDHRLNVDPKTQLNSYGCRPYPRPEAITFSSSTATSISKYAFDAADARRKKFIADAVANGVEAAASNLAQEVRDGIRREMGFEPEVADVVVTASGTDCFLIAQGLSRLLTDLPIATIIIGVEESGSGVKLALQERHFADDTALSGAVHKGELLSGAGGHGPQIDVPVRDRSGAEIPLLELDRQVRELTESNIAAGNFVVIHAMNHSKLGYCGPSRAMLRELKARHGERVCIVVDACQMRLDREEVVEYLAEQMMVVITGSKYFTGPPFCGAILVPEPVVRKIEACGARLDEGFNAYCAREDMPKRLRGILPGRIKPFNAGSLFRWVAALAEMGRYYAIPRAVRMDAVARFCGRVDRILQDTPFIELHARSAVQGAEGELSGRRMIFPFFLFALKGGVRTLCTAEEVQKIYLLMNQDCSARFSYENAREFRLLAQMCHIGQPVSVMHPSGARTSVLRISVGARVFSESYSKTSGRIADALIEDELWQIGVILGKLERLLNALSDKGGLGI